MMMRMNGWIENSGMLVEVQGGFRRGRMTNDNLFMIERLFEVTRSRKDNMFLCSIDLEKAYMIE